MPKTTEDWEARTLAALKQIENLVPYYSRDTVATTMLQLLREFQAEAVGIAKQEALDAKRYGHPCCVHTANCVVVSIESMLPPAKKED